MIENADNKVLIKREARPLSCFSVHLLYKLLMLDWHTVNAVQTLITRWLIFSNIRFARWKNKWNTKHIALIKS